MAPARRGPKSGAGKPGRPRKKTNDDTELPQSSPAGKFAITGFVWWNLTSTSEMEIIQENPRDLASQQLAREALRTEGLQQFTQNTLQLGPGDLKISTEQATEELPILYGTADGILKALALEKDQASLATALGAPDSRLNKKLNALSICLEDEKDPFVTHEDIVFIDSSRLERVLLPSLNNGLIEAIVSKINLATLVLHLRDWYRLDQIPGDALADLDTEFPSPFVTSFSKDGRVGSSKYFQQTFHVALGIRTQMAINILSNHSPSELRGTLIEDVAESTGGSRIPWMRWDDKVNITEMPDQTKEVETRLEELQNIVGTDSKKATKKTLQVLQERFPWSLFVQDVISWVQLRADELSQSIYRSGFTGLVGELRTLLGGGIVDIIQPR
jgi:hypothetical protein